MHCLVVLPVKKILKLDKKIPCQKKIIGQNTLEISVEYLLILFLVLITRRAICEGIGFVNGTEKQVSVTRDT